MSLAKDEWGDGLTEERKTAAVLAACSLCWRAWRWTR